MDKINRESLAENLRAQWIQQKRDLDETEDLLSGLKIPLPETTSAKAITKKRPKLKPSDLFKPKPITSLIREAVSNMENTFTTSDLRRFLEDKYPDRMEKILRHSFSATVSGMRSKGEFRLVSEGQGSEPNTFAKNES